VAVNIAWYNLAMLTQYLEAAMRLAQYEYLTEDGVYYGEIPPLAGVWATGKTLEDCQQELREVLEEWVALRQQWGQSLHFWDLP
jgi:predicted RNase H-like HicB family nuclease